jgi:hypothetical protein
MLTDLAVDDVFFACAGSVAFLAVYLLLARGWRTEIGRALITLDAGLVLVLGPTVLARLTGLELAGIGYDWYSVASLALVGIATWWRAWFVIKVQAGGLQMTPRQFGWHLLDGIGDAARKGPGKVRAWWRELRGDSGPPQAGDGDGA